MTDVPRFSIHQTTGRQFSLPQLGDACRDMGIPAIGPWREPVRA
ncbi:hypothetical protein [Streptomyces sp. NPDC029526]